jgi:hypothetical protein
VATLWALWRELPKDIDIPGIPDDDAEFNVFDQWTAGLLRKGVEVYTAAARITPESLMNKCISSASKKRDEAEEEEQIPLKRGRRWELLLERENRSRMLFEPDVLDNVSPWDHHEACVLTQRTNESLRGYSKRTGWFSRL